MSTAPVTTDCETLFISPHFHTSVFPRGFTVGIILIPLYGAPRRCTTISSFPFHTLTYAAADVQWEHTLVMKPAGAFSRLSQMLFLAVCNRAAQMLDCTGPDT